MSVEMKILKTISLPELTNWSVRYLLNFSFNYNDDFNLMPIGQFLTRNRNLVNIQDDEIYQRVTVRAKNNGVYLRDAEIGKKIGTKKQYKVSSGQFIVSKIDARNGAMGLIPDNLDGAIVTNDFPTFIVDNNRVISQFLLLLTTTKIFINFAQSCSSGTTNRQRINIEQFSKIKIPLPPLTEQNRIVTNYNAKIKQANEQEQKAKALEQEIEDYLFEVLGIEKLEEKESIRGLQFVQYKNIMEWNTENYDKKRYASNKYLMVSLISKPDLFESVFRGKSPKYDENGTSIILNQKCNRWNKIELKFAKKVNDKWFNSIDKNNFTKFNDILINSTGNGTIGRASRISNNYTDLIYDSHILLLRFNHLKVNSLYFSYLFNSPYGQEQVEGIKSAQSTNQTELGIANLKKILFPLPPLKIQTQIANHISDLKQQIKDLKKQANENREKAIQEFEEEIFS